MQEEHLNAKRLATRTDACNSICSQGWINDACGAVNYLNFILQKVWTMARSCKAWEGDRNNQFVFSDVSERKQTHKNVSQRRSHTSGYVSGIWGKEDSSITGVRSGFIACFEKDHFWQGLWVRLWIEQDLQMFLTIPLRLQLQTTTFLRVFSLDTKPMHLILVGQLNI